VKLVEALLTVEERELLAKTAKLMEELIETIEVSNDKELAQDIEDALREVRQGKTRPLQDLARELELDEQVQTCSPRGSNAGSGS
jgi:Trp operon repressor